jgi:chromate reductase
MSDTLNILAVVGSLRRESFTRKLMEAFVSLAPIGLSIEIAGVDGLPLYNEDDEGLPAVEWQNFRARVNQAHAILFATPEYNRSVPGGLKNAIDVGSRPYGHSVWSGKPAAVVSCSPGALGAFGANHHLRQSLVFLDMPTMQQPEAYRSGINHWFDASGSVIDPAHREFCAQFLRSFEHWVRLTRLQTAS